MYISPFMQALLLPRRWVVCDVVVPPLTLWHVYVLRTSRNAYFCCDTLPDLDAATEVLLYASHSLKDVRRMYIDAKYCRRQQLRVHRRLRRCKWQDVDAAITEYVVECTRSPGHKEQQVKANAAKARSLAAPNEWAIAEYICKGDYSNLDHAMCAPYAVACCLFDAGRDVRGEVDTLISERDEERLDRKLGMIA